MTTPPAPTSGGLPQEQIDAFFADAEDPDDYNDVEYIAYTRPPKEALQITIELAKLAPSRHQLCHLGIDIFEPLIQRHWKVLEADIDRALTKHSELRKAFDCVWATGVPKRIDGRWRALVRPDEHVGSDRPDEL